MGNTKKKTFEEVKQVFQKEGYDLLSTEYLNSKQKLRYVCKKEHQQEITYSDFKSGRRCIKCYHERKRQEKLTPIENIRKVFEEEGYTLLTQKHETGNQYFESICPRGHIYKCKLYHFKAKRHKCSKCAAIDNSGVNNPNWNPDREAVKQNGKIWRAWRNNLRSAVLGRNKKTSEEIKTILGYDWNELREHIFNHPNWNLLQDKNAYHVDHIFPIQAFLDYGIKDPKIICALENLQPMDKGENMKKNRYYDKLKFEEYLKSKGIYDSRI